jgi:hypothetical protein
MKLTRDAMLGAMKEAQRLFNRACAENNRSEMARWQAERTRIMKVLATYEENNNG